MKMFSILPHTADLRLHIQGSTLEELFQAGVEALASVLKAGACPARRYTKRREIVSAAPNVTELLIDFLSQVLTLSYAETAVFCTASCSEISEHRIASTVAGVTVDGFDEDVKAVTYHEATVSKNRKGFYETVVVLDM